MTEPYFKNDFVTLYKGDCVEMLSGMEETFDCCIADPPYWKVVNQKWDYQWRAEEDYVTWCGEWFSQLSRLVRHGGTFYLFGYFRTLALLLSSLQEKEFVLRQQIIVDKGMKAVAGRATKNYRMFPTTTESILFLVRDNIPFARGLLKKRQAEMGLTANEINNALGVKSNGGGMWSIYAGRNICRQFPTREQWGRLEDILGFSFPYEKIAQTYNPEMGLTDVWNDIDFYGEKRWHPTQKPLKLIERLVKASSNEGDLIVDPFAGSGATGLACIRLGRKCVLIEKDEKYCDEMVRRFTEEGRQLELF